MVIEKTLSAADLPRLVVQLPDGKEVHHSVVGGEITIGRDPSNRIPIADEFVSKFHAKLVLSGSSFTLVDLGSANKTYVNGEPIREAAVKYGDELRFAGVHCRLLEPQAEERAAGSPSSSVDRAPARAMSSATHRRSAPSKIEADSRRRLLLIGALLLAVALVLVVLWRVVLLRSGDKPANVEEEVSQRIDRHFQNPRAKAKLG